MANVTVNDLTEKELMIMKGGRTNDYSDIIDGQAEWTFAVIDASGLDSHTARGVISSLVKKGLMTVTPQPGEVDSLIAYTDLGIQIAKDLI